MTWSRSRLASLSPSQLKALFLVATDTHLESSEPSSAARAERDGHPAFAGPVAELMDTATQPATPVAELVRVKEEAKKLARDAGAGRELEDARLLYHVSVAAALVHHATKISGRSTDKQLPMYERLAAEWAGHPIGEIFRRAIALAAGE